MAKRKGQVVNATLVTPDTQCTFPVVDVNDVGGGRLIVSTIAERNAIPPKFRKEGMVVRVQGSVKTDYELLAGFSPTNATLVDANWGEYAPGVPPGVLTAHQKAEDIEFSTPIVDGSNTYTKLMQKIAAMDAAIASKLSTHQKVEDILYDNPTASGFATLALKLADMDSKITSAGAIPHIEDINWNIVPAAPGDTHGHQTNLADELEKLYTDMNDPTKIIVTKSDFTTTDLQTMITALERKVPTAQDILYDDGVASPVPLVSLLTNSANAITTIQYNTTTNLKDKIDSLASGLSAIAVEDINWDTTPTTPAGMGRNGSLATEINNIFNKLVDMNDPNVIQVKTSATNATLISLQTKLNNIDSSISAAGAQNVEDIDWGTLQTAGNTNLTRSLDLDAEINTLFSNLDSTITTIADMNDPTKIIVETVGGVDKNLSTKLTELANAHDKVEDIVWNTTPPASTITGGLGRSSLLSAELNTLFGAVDVIKSEYNDPAEIIVADGTSTVSGATMTLAQKVQQLEGMGQAQNIENITWNSTPTLPSGMTRAAGLDDELNNIFNIIKDQNDPAEIIVADGTSTVSGATMTLTNKVAQIDTFMNDLEIPQYLLYNTSAPDSGSLTSQEFLTTYASQICEIALYTNSDATLTNVSGQNYSIQIALEKCESNATSYSIITGTTVEIGASTSGLMNRTDLTSLSTPITLPDNCRLRLNITGYNTANVVDVLNVRVKLVKSA